MIPAELLAQPKSGFGFPVDPWLRGPLKEAVRDALLGNGLAGRGWFDRARLAGLIRAHESGRADHGFQIWALFVLELWARQFLDPPPGAYIARHSASGPNSAKPRPK